MDLVPHTPYQLVLAVFAEVWGNVPRAIGLMHGITGALNLRKLDTGWLLKVPTSEAGACRSH